MCVLPHPVAGPGGACAERIQRAVQSKIKSHTSVQIFFQKQLKYLHSRASIEMPLTMTPVTLCALCLSRKSKGVLPRKSTNIGTTKRIIVQTLELVKGVSANICYLFWEATMFYDRYLALCESADLKPHQAAALIGIKKGSVSYWKQQWIAGREALPDSPNAQKIADYFHVSVDYLLGRTDDPIDYDTDGDALAEIPLTYVEAAGGDMKKARAMLAAERDAQREAQLRSGKLSRFSKQDAELIFALWGDTDDIDERDLEDVKRFAAFIKERKQHQ